MLLREQLLLGCAHRATPTPLTAVCFQAHTCIDPRFGTYINVIPGLWCATLYFLSFSLHKPTRVFFELMSSYTGANEYNFFSLLRCIQYRMYASHTNAQRYLSITVSHDDLELPGRAHHRCFLAAQPFWTIFFRQWANNVRGEIH